MSESEVASYVLGKLHFYRVLLIMTLYVFISSLHAETELLPDCTLLS